MKRLPEQIGYEGLSKEFRTVIDMIPAYGGRLSLDGKTVTVAYLEAVDFDATMPLDSFLQGMAYAAITGKSCRFDIPEGMKEEMSGKIDGLFDDLKSRFDKRW
ncbi:MAG: hypothetical protein V1870_05670 [Candidatus Aenigmatarchaeota archaeon]